MRNVVTAAVVSFVSAAWVAVPTAVVAAYWAGDVSVWSIVAAAGVAAGRAVWPFITALYAVIGRWLSSKKLQPEELAKLVAAELNKATDF